MCVEILSLQGISFGYSGQPVLDGISLKLQSNERVGIIGANGSGKTTLFRLIMGLVTPDDGALTAFGEEIVCEKDFQRLRARVGYLFQNSDDQLFCPTVAEDVAFGPLNLGSSREEALTRVAQTLDRLNINDLRDRITHRLSGGEKKLVALATVLAMQPECLLLDEPTAGLDVDGRKVLASLLRELELPFVLASHDMDFLLGVADVFYEMKNGRLRRLEGRVPHAHMHLHAGGADPHDHQGG